MELAVRYYKEAASLGHPGASVNLSNCYDSGEGVMSDKSRVFELDTFAANLGHPIAINNLGCCYLFGKVMCKCIISGVLLYHRVNSQHTHL